MKIFALMLLCLNAHGQTTSSGDAQVTGQLGSGLPVPQARFDVRMSTADAYALRVSSADGSALLLLDRTGRLGAGANNQSSALDMRGTGDSSDIGLQLRVGNSSSSASSSQLIFALASSATYRHSLRSRAAAGQIRFNGLDFYLWRSTGQPDTLGDTRALSLEGSMAASSGSVHVHPVGEPTAELVVSNGLTMGGGTIHRANSYTPSLRALKREISYLDAKALNQAYEDLKSLRHARFRYKKDPPGTRRRGLIFEEAPASVRGPAGGIVVNERLANLEMALKEFDRKIHALEGRVLEMEKAR